MKALIIEDRASMTQMFCGQLDKLGFEHKVTTNVTDALVEMKDYQPQIILLDSSIEKGKGMGFITAITPVEDEDNRRDRRKQIDRGPSVLVVRTVYEVVPGDCPYVKSVLVRPFSAVELEDALKRLVPKERRQEVPALFKEAESMDPHVELVRMGISYGESYVFFEERPIVVNQVTQTFSNAGYDPILITPARPKVAREKFGLDKGAEIFTLTGSNYPLGTMVKAVSDFIGAHKYPLVVIGELDNIIEHCGTELTMRAVHQILSMRTKEHEFTLLTSVDGHQLTQNVRGLLTEMMTEYNRE